MSGYLRALIWLVGFLHFAFCIAELTLWETATPKLGIYSPEQAKTTAPVGKNMAVYNGIIAAWCFWLVNRSSELSPGSVRSLGTLLLGGVIVAGIVGAWTIHGPIVLFQSCPAAVALFFLWHEHRG